MLMINAKDPAVRKLLLQGNIGLEKESLRVTKDGFFAQTLHPFPGDDNITRDFSENQIEINTTVYKSAREAVEALKEHTQRVQRKLATMPEREYLWPFSNPPYIKKEDNIPIAQFYGEDAARTTYREYLSDRYGRYIMTYSGIHVNFSFADELLEAAFEASDETSFDEFRNKVYLDLAEKAVECCWLFTSITAASPIVDSSFFEKGVYDKTVFNGMGSLRSSELGYWNFFTPVFDYSSLEAYADSIQGYVDDGYINYPSELYYPIRLKPPGKNDHQKLKREGISHIELRMFDLNPFEKAGLDWRDVEFAHLMLVWLASKPSKSFAKKDQVQAEQNFKNAAHYDLKTVKIVLPDGKVAHVSDAALDVIEQIEGFYIDFPKEVQDIIAYEKDKFIDADKRYAWRVRKEFQDDYVRKGMELAVKWQEEYL